MKTRFILMTMFAAMALSCAKENLPENNVADNVETALVPMEFVAGLESKAAIVDGEKTVEWVAGDKISLFDNLGGINAFETEGSGKTVSFTGQVTDGSEEFYALYPYRSGAEFDAATKVVTSKLFPDQKAVLGSYAMAEGGAVMAAKVSEGNVLSFKNMTSHIRFTLAEDLEDVISITLMGNKGEAVAGLYTVDFNGETPVLEVSKPETYVTLRNEDGSALAPGNYFFTILPVEFAEGFTVILSMTDGSQIAKKTTKAITSLGVRNQVLPMAKLNYSDYKPHMNYFVLYNDGFEVTIGGFTFDNTTLPGGRLVGEGALIAEDGLYFIPTSTSEVKTGYNRCKNLYIFGTDPVVRSKFTLANVLQPQSDPEGCVFLAGLEILNPEGKKRIFEQPSDAAFQFDKFGSLIIKNCKISSIVQHVCHFTNKAATLDTFVLENCDYLITGTEANAFVVNTNKMASTINNIIIKNNVFHNIKKG